MSGIRYQVSGIRYQSSLQSPCSPQSQANIKRSSINICWKPFNWREEDERGFLKLYDWWWFKVLLKQMNKRELLMLLLIEYNIHIIYSLYIQSRFCIIIRFFKKWEVHSAVCAVWRKRWHQFIFPAALLAFCVIF